MGAARSKSRSRTWKIFSKSERRTLWVLACPEQRIAQRSVEERVGSWQEEGGVWAETLNQERNGNRHRDNQTD